MPDNPKHRQPNAHIGKVLSKAEVTPEDKPSDTKKVGRVSLAIIAVVIYLAIVVISVSFWQTGWDAVINSHFQAVVGLPMAAALAFIVVVLLPIPTGPIEFEALGVKLKGAAGPTLLWLICFLAIVAAIKLTW